MADAEALLQAPMGGAQPCGLGLELGLGEAAGPEAFERRLQFAAAADAGEAEIGGDRHAAALRRAVARAGRGSHSGAAGGPLGTRTGKAIIISSAGAPRPAMVEQGRRQVSWLAGCRRRPCLPV